MAARIKSTCNKIRGKDKDSGHLGPANDPPELDPRGGLAQSNPAEHINQSPTASKENKYTAPSPFLHHVLSLLCVLWLT